MSILFLEEGEQEELDLEALYKCVQHHDDSTTLTSEELAMRNAHMMDWALDEEELARWNAHEQKFNTTSTEVSKDFRSPEEDRALYPIPKSSEELLLAEWRKSNNYTRILRIQPSRYYEPPDPPRRLSTSSFNQRQPVAVRETIQDNRVPHSIPVFTIDLLPEIAKIQPTKKIAQFSNPFLRQKQEVRAAEIEKKQKLVFTITGTKRFQDHSRYGDDVQAQIFADVREVLGAALERAKMWSDHLGFDTTRGDLSKPLLKTKLDMLHERISRDGWIQTAERGSFLWYMQNRDKMGELIKEHTDRLEELQWHLPSLVAEQQYERQITEGFNLTRLRETFAGISKPDNFQLLELIAREGYDLPIPTRSTKTKLEDDSLLPDDEQVPFEVNGLNPPKLRNTQNKLYWTHFVACTKLALNNQAILLDATRIPEAIRSTIHYCAPHLVPKLDSAPTHSRLCLDMKHDPEGMNMNTEFSREQATDMYGACVYPTLQKYVRAWYKWCEEHKVDIRECVLTQHDVTNAHGQIKCKPDKVQLQAIQLTKMGSGLITTDMKEHYEINDMAGTIAMVTVGSFGPVVVPYAWRPVGLAIREAVIRDQSFFGVLDTYSDDTTTLSNRDNIGYAKLAVEKAARSLYGESAINDSKTKGPADRMESVLGFTINLPKENYRPKLATLEKAMYYFFTIGVLEQLTLQQSQVLHGIAENISRNLAYMRPFVSSLLLNITNPNHRSKPPPEMKVSIEMWQAFSILFCNSPDNFCIPLSSLLDKAGNPDYIIRTDAGPKIIGAKVFNGTDDSLIFSTQYELPWDYDKENESHQNIRESAGHLFAMLLLTRLSRTSRGCTYRWETDSRVAESWAVKDKVKSQTHEASIYFQMAVTLLKARAGLVLHGTTWLSSQEMVDCGVDELSRVRYDGRGNHPNEQFQETTEATWSPLFELLDPNRSTRTFGYHRNLIAVSKAIYAICEDHVFV